MKSFLLLIDLQKGGCENTYSDFFRRIDALLNSKAFDFVISSAYKNTKSGSAYNLAHHTGMLSCDEQALVDGIAQKSDFVITKTDYSAFGAELMEILCRENGGILPECVYIAGMDTECCVLLTASDLFKVGIRPVVLTEYCHSSGGKDAHLSGIRSMESIIGKNNLFDQSVNSKADLETALAESQNNCPPKGKNLTKAEVLVKLLASKKWHITFAESCTGGKAAAGIVDVASASSVFDASFVTYANQAKIKYLGVAEKTIENCGVVSEEVAMQMAVGAAKANNAEVGVGISGIAGPSGGTKVKPVGTVCFGFFVNGNCFSATKKFGNIGRNAVRDSSVEFVYKTLIDVLKG